MPRTWIFSVAAALLIVLLIFEKRGRAGWILAAKTPLSALFIFTALMAPHARGAYSQFLLSGLTCCMAGDVCLALRGRRMFLLGLVAFLCGHAMYLLGFVGLSGVNAGTLVGLFLTAPAAYGVFSWLKPHLGAMRGPVLLYILVISLMLSAAWGAAAEPRLAAGMRALVSFGALSFYLSDIFVARQRFVTQSFGNRLTGLPLYYFGQFMLAASAGYP